MTFPGAQGAFRAEPTFPSACKYLDAIKEELDAHMCALEVYELQDAITEVREWLENQ